MYNYVDGRIEPKGWILEHLRRDRDGITGNLDKLCPDADCSIFKDKKVADVIDGYWSSWWPGETEGNWMIAFIDLAIALGEENLLQKAANIVYHCVKHQESDGYMGIYLPGERFNAGKRSGELWTQSRLMNAILSLYRYNKDENLLNALTAMADLTVRQYGPLAEGRSFYKTLCEDGSKTHGLMIIEPLLDLYATTGTKEYLVFSEWLYEDFSNYVTVDFPTSDMAIKNAIDPEIPFIAHGPHTCEQLRIPLLLYTHTGNPIYKAVYNSAIVKLRRVTTLSGSCKSDELIGVFQSHIPKENRAGVNIGECLPLPSAGYEYCSTTELVYSYMAGMKHLGDAKYADWEEWMVLNAAMAARRQDGKAIQYLCADNCWDATHKRGARWDFSPTHADAAVCCAPNAGKLMPAHLAHMWLQDGNKLYAALYGPCALKTTVDGQPVVIEEDTTYPFETTLRFTIKLKNPLKFSLIFRIPSWSKRHTLMINGDTVKAKHSPGIPELILENEYNNGDVITLSFDTATDINNGIDGTFALSYGPLLYALDIPAEGVNYFSYEEAGFYDTDYLPKEGANWDYTFLNKEASLVHHENKDFLWDNPPISLETVMLNSNATPEKVSLTPIGATVLKRTTFPMASPNMVITPLVARKEP